jgi:hypothetical protein
MEARLLTAVLAPPLKVGGAPSDTRMLVDERLGTQERLRRGRGLRRGDATLRPLSLTLELLPAGFSIASPLPPAGAPPCLITRLPRISSSLPERSAPPKTSCLEFSLSKSQGNCVAEDVACGSRLQAGDGRCARWPTVKRLCRRPSIYGAGGGARQQGRRLRQQAALLE